jgi:hypothetical protein
MEDTIEIHGGCHCKAVRYTAQTSKQISVYKCNCSICEMKQNHHFMVNKSQIKIEAGEGALKSYQFNTKVAVHMFCGTCGICPFYSPRSNPDCYALTIYCVDDWKKTFPAGTIEWVEFDGENWEQQMESSDIKKHSSS